MTTAGHRGHFCVLNYVHEQGCPLEESAFLGAVLACQLKALPWLCAQTPPRPWAAHPATPSLAYRAETRAHLLTWLLSHSP